MKKYALFIILGIVCCSVACGKKEEDLGDRYILGEDNQYYFSREGKMTESEENIYFASGQYIYVKDKKGGEATVLCDKPDCLHDKETDWQKKNECNAYYGMPMSIQYYRNHLYILSNELNEAGQEVSIVFEMGTGGDERKKILEPKELMLDMMVHRGYIYISFSDFLDSPDYYEKNKDKRDNSRFWVERYNIDKMTGKSEVIYEKYGEFGQINHMMAYGNYIYMKISETDIFSDTIIYNIQSKKTSKADGYVFGNPMIFDNQLAYFETLEGDETGSYDELMERHKNQKVTLADLSGKKVGEGNIPFDTHVYVNDKYVVCDNRQAVLFEAVNRDERTTKIYNKSGKLLRKMKTGNSTLTSLGMNEDYYFYRKFSQNENLNPEIWVVDLSRIDDESYEGELFFSETDVQ